jgi:hypothetical protein
MLGDVLFKQWDVTEFPVAELLFPASYSLDLIPTDLKHFGALKNAVPGKRFDSYDEVNEEMKMLL